MTIIIILILLIISLYLIREKNDVKYQDLISDYRKYLPLTNKKNIYSPVILILLISVTIFHYIWFFNLKNHVYRFFSVKYESFVHIIVVIFFGVLSIVSAFLWGYFLVKNKYIIHIYNELRKEVGFFVHAITVFSAILIILYFVVVIFIDFEQTNYFDNYHLHFLRYGSEDGFWQYIKSLTFAFAEITIRSFVFFIVISFSLNLIEMISSFIQKREFRGRRDGLSVTLVIFLALLFLIKIVLPFIISCVYGVYSWF